MFLIIIYKICSTCGLEKPVSEFNIRPHKTTYESDCKECQKENGPNDTNSDYLKKTKQSISDHIKQIENIQVVSFPAKNTNKTTKIVRRRKL